MAIFQVAALHTPPLAAPPVASPGLVCLRGHGTQQLRIHRDAAPSDLVELGPAGAPGWLVDEHLDQLDSWMIYLEFCWKSLGETTYC